MPTHRISILERAASRSGRENRARSRTPTEHGTCQHLQRSHEHAAGEATEHPAAKSPSTLQPKSPSTLQPKSPSTLQPKSPSTLPRSRSDIIPDLPMRAMALMRAGAGCVEPSDRDVPVALPGEVLVKVRACGVCRTDLHLVDGDLPAPELPIIPGHEIVGVVDVVGDGVTHLKAGDRVGIPWLGYSCGECGFCVAGRENLCVNARFTGYHNDGGYAEYAVADARYAFKIPDGYSDVEAAPLMCAGLIGYRAYRMAGEGLRLGFYGFGAAAHLIVQVAVHDKRDVFAFTKPGDADAQQFARELGVTWAGAS